MSDNNEVPTVPMNMIPLQYRLMLAALPELGQIFAGDEETQEAIAAQEAQRAEQEQRDREDQEQRDREEQEQRDREEAERREREDTEKREKEESEKRKQEEMVERLAHEGLGVWTPQQLLAVMEQLIENRDRKETGPTSHEDIEEVETFSVEELERERKTIAKISTWTGGKFEGTLEMEPRKLLMMWEEWSKRFLIACSSKDIKSKAGKLVTLQSVANDLISRLLDTQGIVDYVKAGCFTKTWSALNKYFKDLGSSVDAVTEFRSMKMEEKDNFSAWFLKLNQQLLLCDIPLDKHPYELKHTILTGVVQEIKLKLMEAGGEKLTLPEIKEKAVTFDRLRRENMTKEPEKSEDLFAVSYKRSRSKERSYGSNRFSGDRGPGTKSRRFESPPRFGRREDEKGRYGQRYNSGWTKTGFDGNCRKCQSYGHKAVDCMKDKCFNCGETGHFAASCQIGINKKRYKDDKSDVSKKEEGD